MPAETEAASFFAPKIDTKAALVGPLLHVARSPETAGWLPMGHRDCRMQK